MGTGASKSGNSMAARRRASTLSGRPGTNCRDYTKCICSLLSEKTDFLSCLWLLSGDFLFERTWKRAVFSLDISEKSIYGTGE